MKKPAGKTEKDYQNNFYSKEKQELLDHLPEWLKVLRGLYLKYKISLASLDDDHPAY